MDLASDLEQIVYVVEYEVKALYDAEWAWRVEELGVDSLEGALSRRKS
jgi:hypothetical protein